MKENTDYLLVHHDRTPDEYYSIEILTGPHSGVIFTYGTISVLEETDEDGEEFLRLKFDYRINDNMSEEFKKFADTESFENCIGDILHNILENGTFKIGHNDAQPSANNPESSSSH